MNTNSGLFYTDLPSEEFKDQILLKDYKVKRTELKEIFGKTYLYTLYGGKHENEYTIAETENGVISGKVQLFKRGIIQMSWVQNDQERCGELSIYDNGYLTHTYTWDYFLKGKNLRVVKNGKNQSLLTIIDSQTKQVIYRGQYAKGLIRDGNGIEYDRLTGVEKLCGIFRNDKLVHIHCEFLDNQQMVEYQMNEDNNLDIIDRSPVYIGGYKKIDLVTFTRSGLGKSFFPSAGIAREIVEWKENNSNTNSFEVYMAQCLRELSLREATAVNQGNEYKVGGSGGYPRNNPMNLNEISLSYTHLNLNSISIIGDINFSPFELLQGITLQHVLGDRNVILSSLLRLSHINISNSFQNAPSIKITNCPRIQSIKFDNSFNNTGVFSLKGTLLFAIPQ